ncbi:MAG: hypothetical protein AB1374_01920 [Bacillota bacterium]
MPERNVVASFKNAEDAERALDKLKDLGVSEVEICEPADLRDGLADDVTTIADEEFGPTGLRVDADVRGQDVSPLRPATDLVSTADEDEFEATTGENVYLRAMVDESLYERAFRILRETGGRV